MTDTPDTLYGSHSTLTFVNALNTIDFWLCGSGDALALLRFRTSDQCIVASNRGGPMRANSIVNWFVALFATLGYEGCSSHSGRRTFITVAARNLHRAGCSLRDVQLLAGHCSIDLTQRYIEGFSLGQRRLVAMG